MDEQEEVYFPSRAFAGPYALEIKQIYSQMFPVVKEAIRKIKEVPIRLGQPFRLAKFSEILAALEPVVMPQKHGLSLRDEALHSSWFDSGTALGKVALMAATCDIFDHLSPVEIVEIRQNSFVPYLLAKYLTTKDENYLDDIIFAETSRFALFFKGRLYDPLSLFAEIEPQEADGKFRHDTTLPWSAWELITAARFSYQSLLVDDFEEAQRLHDKAQALCQDLLISQRVQIIRLLGDGHKNEAKYVAEKVHALAPTAENLYFLYLASGHDIYLWELENKYSDKMVTKLKARLQGFLPAV